MPKSYSIDEVKVLVGGRIQKIEEKRMTWERWQNAYEGKSWWSTGLPTFKKTEIDNQIFPHIDSLIGTLQRASIWDRVSPPSNQERDLNIAHNFEEALHDFWRENKRDSRIQSWLRTTFIKGRMLGFIRVDQKAEFPFICDAFGPEDFVYSSDRIDDIQKQPWIGRVLETRKGILKAFNQKLTERLDSKFPGTDSRGITVYDFWSKETNQNMMITADGLEIKNNLTWKANYYPYFEIADISILNSAEPISTVGMAYALQKTYDQERAQIRENAEYMGNPPIVVDVESGIDTSRIEGRPRLIIRKWRDGKFEIVRVPSLPGYVERQPEVTRTNLQRVIGVNEMMMRGQASGVREKGAMSLLLSGPFARADLKIKNIKKGINEANNILIELFQKFVLTTKRAFSDELGIRYLAFSPTDIKGKFRSEVEIEGLEPGSERRTHADLHTAMRLGSLDQKTYLQGLGYRNPEIIIKGQEQDQKRRLDFERQKAEFMERQTRAKGLREAIAVRKVPPTKEEIERRVPSSAPAEREREKPEEEKTEVKRYPQYVDFMGNILVPGLKARLRTLDLEKEVRVVSPVPEQMSVPSIKIYVPSENDRETIAQSLKEIAGKITFIGTTKKQLEKIKKEPVIIKSGKKASMINLKTLVLNVKKGIIKKKTLTDSKLGAYQGMPGMYLVKPHAEMIWTGQKKLLLKGRNYQNQIGREVLLLGDKVYGLITLIYGGEISEEYIKKTARLHKVSPKEVKKWWGRKPLYAYAFELKRFKEPLAYEKPAGLQTYLKETKLILPGEKTEVPQAKPVTGGLKVASISPMKPTPVAKSEKKSMSTAEVYSAKRLKEILPEGHDWDVSWKADGIRCFVHKKGDKIKFFSDEAKDIPIDRLKPLVDEIKKKFHYDCILDGELMLFRNTRNLKHQGVAGYIHGKWTPKPEELKGLRYVIWDLLFVKGQDIAKKPFEARSKALDLFLPYKKGTKDQVYRVFHKEGSLNEVPRMAKEVRSNEGVVVKAMDSSYFATHLLFKEKAMYELDVKVIAKETTKTGAWTYHSILADGTYMGESYAVKYVKAKPGDVIRMTMQHITLRPDGSIGWFGPKPVDLKAKYLKAPAPKGKGLVEPKIGRPDTIGQVKEIFLAGGGTEKHWNEWWPKFQIWKKEVMPKIIAKVKSA